MKVIKRINPGQPGSKQYLKEFGESLFCVRYRPDQENNNRITTIELIVDKGFYLPAINSSRHQAKPEKNQQVYLRIAYEENEIRQKVKNSGGRWRPEKKCWQLNYRDTIKLGLKEKIVE